MKQSARLAERLDALSAAVEACEGRSDPEAVERARGVLTRAGQRLAFSGELTVIALAGSTGSGKSSLFNRLTGTELAEVAMRRPTTARAMAVGWGTGLPNELLDWLDAGQRHLIASPDPRLGNLVLLDMPDHDSTEEAHRVAVDRLVELVDALVWVADPQKYADAALHEGYLKPLASHADVMMVVLNQVDRLDKPEVERCMKDLRHLLDAEGLKATPLMATSAVRGDGIYELREALLGTVDKKRAMVSRFGLDVTAAARALSQDLGPKVPARLNPSLCDAVTATLADAAGVPVVTEGLRRAWQRRGRIATGWPLLSWIGRLRPDPLKLLRIGPAAQAELSPTEVSRTSLPKATSVQKARVDQGLRKLVDQASEGMPTGWAKAVHDAAHANESLLSDDLDTAIAGTDLKVKSPSWWWLVFTLLQWLLILAVVCGLVWWLAGPLLAVSGFGVPVVSWYGVPAGLCVAVAGGLAGLVLAGIGRLLVRAGAAARARRARKQLDAAVTAVVTRQVFGPVQLELDRYHGARDALRKALKQG